MIRLSRIKVKYALFLAVVASFTAAFMFGGVGSDSIIQDSINFIGILFGIIVGFFIADLYTRYSSIRENAASDSSCLSTFYFFATVLAEETGDKEWLGRVEGRLEKYVHKFMPLGWEEYDKTEKEFAEIGESLKELKYDTDKANEAYSNILAVYNQHSTARENLVMYGRDKLSWGEWLITLFLGVLLLVSLFYVKDTTIISSLFTGSISAAILLLFIVVRDLNNLDFGENSISVEPYERVLDAMGKPRYYGSNKTNDKDSHSLV